MDEKSPTELKHSPSEGLTDNSSIGHEDTAERPKKARRTFLTQNACTRCRQKKSKCDGKRPVCARCEKHGAECQYDVAQEGITRMQNLQQQLDTRNVDHSKLMSLFNAFQHGSDYEATTLLARLRLGASIDDLLSFAEATETSSPENPSGPSSSVDQLPHGYWPPSPMDEGSWTSWSTRCELGDMDLSQSSGSQPKILGTGSRFNPSNTPLLTGREYQFDGLRDGSYHQQQREGYPSHRGNVPYSPMQWQNLHSSDANVNPALMNSSAQFYGDREEPPGRMMQQDQSHVDSSGRRQRPPHDGRSRDGRD